jgi:hypothetical protein
MEDDIHDRLRTARSPDRLLALVGEHAADQEALPAFTRALVATHNAGDIDVVEAFCHLTQTAAPDFWLSRLLFETALPELQAPVSSVMKCCLALVANGGGDAAAGSTLNAYANFLAKETARCDEALRLIEANPNHTLLLVATLAAQSRSSLSQAISNAQRFFEHADGAMRPNAVYALTRLDWPATFAVPDTLHASLSDVLMSEGDEHVLASTLKAVCELARIDASESQRWLLLAGHAAARGGERSVQAAAEILGFGGTAPPPAVRDLLMGVIRKVDRKNIGTAQTIDFALVQLAKADRAAAIDVLEHILVSSDGELSLDQSFKHTASQIRRDMAWMGKLLTRWFLKGTPPLCRAVQDILGGYAGSDPHPAIDVTEIDVNNRDHMLFVAKKTVGYLFFQVKTAVSVLLSLIALAPEALAQELADLLYDTLLLNFAAARTAVVTAAQTQTSPTKEILEERIRRLDAYLNNLPSGPVLPALQPSQAHREIQQRRHKQMLREGWKRAESQSFFLNLFPTSTLLYGRSSINYIVGDGQTPHRVAMPLQKHGVEVEVPRLSIVDPFDLDYALTVFRAEQRPS